MQQPPPRDAETRKPLSPVPPRKRRPRSSGLASGDGGDEEEETRPREEVPLKLEPGYGKYEFHPKRWKPTPGAYLDRELEMMPSPLRSGTTGRDPEGVQPNYRATAGWGAEGRPSVGGVGGPSQLAHVLSGTSSVPSLPVLSTNSSSTASSVSKGYHEVFDFAGAGGNPRYLGFPPPAPNALGSASAASYGMFAPGAGNGVHTGMHVSSMHAWRYPAAASHASSAMMPAASAGAGGPASLPYDLMRGAPPPALLPTPSFRLPGYPATSGGYSMYPSPYGMMAGGIPPLSAAASAAQAVAMTQQPQLPKLAAPPPPPPPPPPRAEDPRKLSATVATTSFAMTSSSSSSSTSSVGASTLPPPAPLIAKRFRGPRVCNDRDEYEPPSESKMTLLHSSSRYRGVFWDSGLRAFRAKLKIRGRTWYLGIFEKQLDAARQYDAAARHVHGPRALVNFSADFCALIKPPPQWVEEEAKKYRSCRENVTAMASTVLSELSNTNLTINFAATDSPDFSGGSSPGQSEPVVVATKKKRKSGTRKRAS